MVSDRVGDFIVRLQNAARIGKQEVEVPYSKHLAAVAQKLKELGYLASTDTKQHGARTILQVTLATNERGAMRLRGVKRISKPGRRWYTGHANTHSVKGGTGMRIMTTSAGILTDREVRKQHVGGEALFEIW